MKIQKAFTLIELLIVIAIIGILASIVLVSLSSAKTKANISKAQSFGQQLVIAFQACDASGGEITVPNSTTTPTNDLCTIPLGIIWPSPLPQGMSYNQSIYTNGSDNLVFMLDNGPNQLYCGYYVNWSAYCNDIPALCTISQRYGCAFYSPSLYNNTGYNALF
jgi:prepilin-type N-terminal cleavage/methylation domain-containing protein